MMARRCLYCPEADVTEGIVQTLPALNRGLISWRVADAEPFD